MHGRKDWEKLNKNSLYNFIFFLKKETACNILNTLWKISFGTQKIGEYLEVKNLA